MKTTIYLLVLVVLLLIGVRYINDGDKYNPAINPADFTSIVKNKYFKLEPGKKSVFELKKNNGDVERVEVYVTDEKKTVMGVETVVVWDRVWLNGELIEDTRDWYAEDKDGNVWYFGEDTHELVGGEIVNAAGAWEAGVDSAMPGIVMKTDLKVGDIYRQEYYKGQAEDMAEVLSLGESVIVPLGNFSDCLKTRDYTPLEPSVNEYKYYCPEVGGLVLEVDAEDNERVELISLEYNATSTATFSATTSAATTTTGATTKPATPPASTPVSTASSTSQTPTQNIKISEEKAKEIALKRIPGKVTDIAIETKFGKETYVVEVDPSDSYKPETDVIIDIYSGEVLGVES